MSYSASAKYMSKSKVFVRECVVRYEGTDTINDRTGRSVNQNLQKKKDDILYLFTNKFNTQKMLKIYKKYLIAFCQTLGHGKKRKLDSTERQRNEKSKQTCKNWEKSTQFSILLLKITLHMTIIDFQIPFQNMNRSLAGW